MENNKLISFSLWGNNLKYLVGAIKNAQLSKDLYKDFKCRFYCDIMVPNGVKYQLEDLDCEIIEMNVVGNYFGMYWRMAAINEADLVLIRDCDSRLNEREKYCVDEFIKSDKLFHSIQDHPYHQFKIMPGLAAFKRSNINFKSLLSEYSGEDKYGTDYCFYDSIFHLIKDDLLVHDDFSNKGIKINFKRNKLHFCGEIFNENDDMVREHQEAIRQSLEERTNNVYIYHHLGLGDCIDCNAIIRNCLKEYDRVFVFCKQKYYRMVEYMYRDNLDIIVIPLDSTNFKNENKREYILVHDFIINNNIKNFLKIGHENYPWGKEVELGKGCAELFYEHVGVDYQKRFDDFYFQRDRDEEKRVFNKLNPNNESYIFVHDDKERDFEITNEKIYEIYGKEIKIIRNDKTENIFHFFKLLEDAEQIHLMESSFKSLVEILKMKKQCYFHNFRKEAASSYLGKTRQEWIEIKY